MPTFELTTHINALPERCFDLARDIDFHQRSMAHTGERAVGGVTRGLIGLGEEVTWEAKHFGVRQRFTARITAFAPPHHFEDTMVRGAFAAFRHQHVFEPTPGGTAMRDIVEFRSPLGPLGWLVDQLVMTAYLRRLLARRAALLKTAAEAED